MTLSSLKREDFLYQAYYCEENIWHLCQHEQLRNSYVIIIASKGDSFPMLCQRAMSNPSTPIFWDYHVILLVQAETNQILDFDTTLPFTSDVDSYFSRSFIDNELLGGEQMPLFKVIAASDYIRLFSSDRSHMKDESGWIALPPDWPLIGTADSNLSDLIDMSNDDIGEVLIYDALLKRFC